MGIIRRELEFESQYTSIPNEWLRDGRLSWRARGILAGLLSHRPGWVVSVKGLSDGEGAEGRDAVRTALAELRGFGYLTVVAHRGEGGRVEGQDYVLTDPTALLETRSTDNPQYGESAPKKTITLEEHSPEDTPLEPPQPKSTAVAVVAPQPDEFDEFWQAYPRHVGKTAARKAFDKARRSAPMSDIIQGALRFNYDPNRVDEFTPHPATWLNAGRWDDDPLPERRSDMSAARKNLDVVNYFRQLEAQGGNDADSGRRIANHQINGGSNRDEAGECSGLASDSWLPRL